MSPPREYEGEEFLYSGVPREGVHQPNSISLSGTSLLTASQLAKPGHHAFASKTAAPLSAMVYEKRSRDLRCIRVPLEPHCTGGSGREGDEKSDDAPGGELSLPGGPLGFAVGHLHRPVLGVGLQELFDGTGPPPHYHLEPLLLEAFPDPGLPADATADVLPGCLPGAPLEPLGIEKATGVPVAHHQQVHVLRPYFPVGSAPPNAPTPPPPPREDVRRPPGRRTGARSRISYPSPPRRPSGARANPRGLRSRRPPTRPAGSTAR